MITWQRVREQVYGPWTGIGPPALPKAINSMINFTRGYILALEDMSKGVDVQDALLEAYRTLTLLLEKNGS